MVYVGGALGVELIGGFVADRFGRGALYKALVVVEESAEMVGITIFVHALLAHLAREGRELRIRFVGERTTPTARD